MIGEARHIASMIHTPAIFDYKVLPNIASAQVLKVNAHGIVSLRVLISVICAEEEGVLRLPWKTKRSGIEYCVHNISLFNLVKNQT